MAAGTGFPYVLYDLLKKESSSIVMWTSTGTAFGIRDMAAFRQEVLTCYFKHNKFSSFQRQLNLYGFRKVVKGRESGCYMHPSFLRDCPEKLTEVKRGVVPPCPAHYSRKIYGSGPRFMSQDDGSDSEPELVVQPRGHWDKTLAHSDVATHMKLGEMHVTAAALAAARAHVKGDSSNMNSSQTAAAALAAAHHLQEAQAQLQMRGIPGNGRPPPPSPPSQGMHLGRHMSPQSQDMDIDVGGRMAQHQQQQQHGMMGRMGAGGGGMYGGDIRGSGAAGAGNEGTRSRQRGLTKMFGSSRPQMGAGGGSRSSGGMPPPPTSSPFNHSPQRQHLGHQHLQQQLHEQQLHHQQQHQMEQQQRYRASAAMVEEQEGGSDGRGPMGSGHMFSPRLPTSDGGGQDGGVGMSMGASGSGGAGGISDARNPVSGAPGRPGQSSTVASLSKMLEGLEQTLDCPLAEEMYTPIDKRNSFCAQMVNIAQVLEDDPAMHGMEAKTFQGNNNPLTSQIVQKRRSSMSELAAYLSDMLEDGESSRSVATTPGWSLPPPIPQSQAEYPPSRDGTGSRGAYKRTLDGEYDSYGAFGMDATDTSSSAAAAVQTDRAPSAAPGWDGAINRDGGARGNQSNDSPRSNPKRARTNPISPVSASFPSMGSHEGKVGGEHGQGREGSAVPGAKVAASPNLVQALTCLASALPGHSDSEESKDGAEGSGVGKKEKGRGHAGAASAGPADFRDGGRSTASVIVKEESVMGRESSEEATRDAEKQRDRGSETGHSPVGRVGNNAINDVLKNFSIDQAIEQLKADDDKEGNETGNRSGDFEEKGLRHRASVYVLMHAIATVNTVNEGDQWGQQDAQEEPLDCPENSVAASI